jgi:hypothetical protein
VAHNGGNLVGSGKAVATAANGSNIVARRRVMAAELNGSNIMRGGKGLGVVP